MFIKKEEVVFSELSMMDDFGRVFFYKGKVFRGIYEDKKENCSALLKSELFKELIENEYIPKTCEVDLELEGFAMIIQHEYIDKSEPHHWSFSMYKNAILRLLDINKLCNKFGYELKDAHPYNIFFRNNEPVFIDLGSISARRNKSEWIAYSEFMNYCYLQFLIWLKGDYFLARKLIEDGNISHCRTIPMIDIFESSFTNLVKEDLFEYNLKIKGRTIFSSRVRKKIISALVNSLNSIIPDINAQNHNFVEYNKELRKIGFVENKIKIENRPMAVTAWQHYHAVYSDNGQIKSSPRFDRIIELVKEITVDINTAVDLAGNQGIFSYILSKNIPLKRVVLTDYDETAIDAAYLFFKQNKVKIQPYLYNFMRPLKNEEIEFLKADIAFALAITHHLVLSQRYLLPAIFSRIAQLTNKYVVIEFMPLGLWSPGNKLPHVPKWYTVDWFRSEFQQTFKLLKEEHIEKNRIVFIGLRNDLALRLS